MAVSNLEIEYVLEGDLLCLWGSIHEPVKGGDVTTHTILTAFHSRKGDGECRGFYLFDAAQMLLPVLKGGELGGELHQGELSAAYSCESDTLTLLSNRHTSVRSYSIAEGLTAHCTERGWAVGFTLERAAELLLPHLETWRPWTDEEMTQIRKQKAEREASLRERGVKFV